ncbi:MAG: hypothetical protein QXX83_03480 [Thermofilum sp.]
MPLRDLRSFAARNLAILLAALLLPAALLLFVNRDLYAVYVNVYTAAASFAALLSGLALLRAYAGSPRQVTQPLLFLVTGVALWALAETVYTGFIILYGEAPALSVCDALWLAGYPLLFLWLWTLSRPFSSQLERLGVSTGSASLLIIFSIALAVTATAVVYVKAGADGQLSLAQLVDSSYTVLDAVLLAMSASTVRAFRGGALGFAYWLVALGLIHFSVADLLYFAAGTPVFVPADLLYAASYVLVTLGLRVNLEILRESGREKHH